MAVTNPLLDALSFTSRIITLLRTALVLPAVVVGTTEAQTLTNKRITERVTSVASSATPTPNADTDDGYRLTALAVAAAFVTPTGTPTDLQPMVISILDNGTIRALSFDAGYRVVGVVLPTTTVASKLIIIGMLYNSVAIKWDIISVSQQV